MSVSVDDDVFLDGVDASILHQIWLPSGSHDVTFTLEDSTGAVRTGVVQVVMDLAADRLIASPDDLTSFAPGQR